MQADGVRMTELKLSSNHPPLPPTSEDNRVSWLRLLRSRRVGVSTFFRLMNEHGSAEAALRALPDVAAAAGVQNYSVFSEKDALKEIHAAKRIGARMLCIGDAAYPADLASLPDAPPILWVRGDVSILSRPMIALIGARNASSLGLRMARFLARDLGKEGLVTVSGLARGVDTAAHQTSLETGTVAVLGGGVDVVYPPENAKLMDDIVSKGGALLSEQPIGTRPLARHFPVRNRIVSGLSKAVVVIEAAAKSGSLITSQAALDQGRDVMAVPGHPFDARAGGCNMLLRDGARLVRSGQDVIDALGPFVQCEPAKSVAEIPETPVQEDLHLGTTQAEPSQSTSVKDPDSTMRNQRALTKAAELHQQILDRLGPSPVQEDQLIRDLQAPTGKVNPILTDLELDGRIRRAPGGYLSLVTK